MAGYSLTGWDVHLGKSFPTVRDTVLLTACCSDPLPAPQEATAVFIPHLDRPGYEQSVYIHHLLPNAVVAAYVALPLSSLLDKFEALALPPRL